MPAKTATTSHKENLLEGALLCLQERGYAHTTARDIVAASGANLGAIGYHYGSTERLLNEALLAGFERWFEELAAAAAEAVRESEPLIAIARALPLTFERNRPMARAFIEAVAQAESSEEVRVGLVDCYARGRELLVALLAPESPPSPELNLVASFLLAVFDGFLIQWLLDPEQAPDAEAMAGLAAAFSPVLGLQASR
jgi:AcrR family transcriptional regulator